MTGPDAVVRDVARDRTTHPLLALQRSAGNRAVLWWLASRRPEEQAAAPAAPAAPDWSSRIAWSAGSVVVVGLTTALAAGDVAMKIVAASVGIALAGLLALWKLMD